MVDRTRLVSREAGPRRSAHGYPNRMAPNTAAALLLVGLALLLLEARSRLGILAGQFAALATAIIALLADHRLRL